MKKLAISLFIISLILFYVGVFLGDLGGIGGYDGIAPHWLYEEVVLNSKNEIYFNLAQSWSIYTMLASVILFPISLILALFLMVKKYFGTKDS